MEDKELSEKEKEALHEMQLGRENIIKAYGHLAEFHHKIGRGMSHFADAEELLDEGGLDSEADDIGQLLPKDVFDDYWTYEFMEKFKTQFYDDVVETESDVRHSIADGRRHISERELESMLEEEYET